MKKKKALNWILPGILLIGLSLGALFSIELVKYAYYILLGVAIVLVYYINESVGVLSGRRKTSPALIYFGYIGLFLISGFFGMQSRQIPFKIWFLLIGIVLIVIGWMKR